MTAVLPTAAAPPRAGGRAVVAALARQEARRMLRNPVLALGLGASAWLLTLTMRATEDWPGAAFAGVPVASAPLLLALSVVVAASFHRERAGLAVDGPVEEPTRAAARLLATTPVLAVVAVFTAVIAWWERHQGGLSLGEEPGYTAQALHSLPELLQHVALAFAAVAFGAALGRRLPTLVAAVPLLFVSWFAVAGVYWAFGDRRVTPWSVVQVQPVYLPVAPDGTDPSSLPEHWLLEGPNDYSDVWVRLFTSAELAWWHDLWLIGLGLLWLAVAVPGRRRVLLTVGLLAAVPAVVGQYLVIP